MAEILIQLTSIVRSMWRYRWLGLICAWIVGAVGAVVAMRIPDRFEASARIYVDTQSILKPLMQGLAIQPNIDQQVNMLSRTLISRPNIEKLVRMADLDLKSNTKSQTEDLIENLTKSIEIKSTGRDNLYLLNYVDPDREKAKRVIQSMVSIFVESSLGASRKDTDSAKVFLDEQIKTYEAKLEESEARVKEFRLKNLDLQTAEGRDSASRLGEISQSLQRAKLELREAEQARDSAKQQLEVERSGARQDATQSLLGESKVAVSTPEIDARIETQKRNLDALLQRYTDSHPDVINTRRLLKELDEQKKKEVAEQRRLAAATAATPTATNASPAVAELSKLLANAEVQVAALRARVAEYSARYAQGKSMIRATPQLEAEFAQLNRDYAIVKKNYEDLVARRQAAVMSGDLDMASGVADFRLIDPPRVNPKPVFPNRMLLLAIVIAASLATGLGTAFGASLLRPTFIDGVELRNRTGLPLLGVVSMALSDDDRQRERRDRFRFLAGSGSLAMLLMFGMVTVAILAARQAG